MQGDGYWFLVAVVVVGIIVVIAGITALEKELRKIREHLAYIAAQEKWRDRHRDGLE